MDDERPTFGSLFAGIGGIDLGLERAGWRCRWQVEWDDYCQHVLAHHWPDIRRYGDIAAVDWSGVERVDLLAGGFPCQPWSVAGKQRGLDDDRWLWPEFERAIRHLRPRYVLVENVPGLLVGGGMDLVLGGLAELGYDAEWESIPAAAVGAPHLRYRVWIIAHRQGDASRPDANGQRPHRAAFDELGSAELRDEQDRDARSVGGPLAYAGSRNGGSRRPGRPQHGGQGLPEFGSYEDVPDRERERLEGLEQGRTAARANHRPGDGRDPGWWATEPDVGRMAHGVPARVDRLRALGNAVVPQVVEYIGRRILEAEGLS